ncbi:hypothetical protein FRB99_007389 [Tulasnella sp. 403]|nr:hypothetical protein FRB99_007389 [Tulasnella sp. 403]
MPLPDEEPLTAAEILAISQHVDDLLESHRSFVNLVKGVAVAPAVFDEIPTREDELQTLIDAYALLYDLLPTELHERQTREMLSIRDDLAEVQRPVAADSSLSEEQWGTEEGPRGLRLAVHQPLVESLMYDAGFTNREIAKFSGISRNTLQRRLEEWGIRRRNSTLDDTELEAMIRDIKTSVGLFYGERAVFGLIRARGHWAPRFKIRAILRRVDPEGVSTRWRQAIRRRAYWVPFPNSLWHIDGHHKLIRWKIVTHGGVDGKTRMVVFLRASNNNQADTVARAFHDAVLRHGWPSRVRADWGGENVLVKLMMESTRGQGRGSFFAGPSTHNQRIERLWRDVFTWTIQPFYRLFYLMEDRGVLDHSNSVHLWALHYVFLPRINHALDTFRDVWNNHPLSTEGNKSPNELFTRGLFLAKLQGYDLNLSPSNVLDDLDAQVQLHYPNFTHYGAEFRGAQRERRDTDPHVVFEAPAPPFNMSEAEEDQLAEHLAQISEEEDVLGMEKYLELLRWIRSMYGI